MVSSRQNGGQVEFNLYFFFLSVFLKLCLLVVKVQWTVEGR